MNHDKVSAVSRVAFPYFVFRRSFCLWGVIVGIVVVVKLLFQQFYGRVVYLFRIVVVKVSLRHADIVVFNVVNVFLVIDRCIYDVVLCLRSRFVISLSFILRLRINQSSLFSLFCCFKSSFFSFRFSSSFLRSFCLCSFFLSLNRRFVVEKLLFDVFCHSFWDVIVFTFNTVHGIYLVFFFFGDTCSFSFW